MVDIPVDVHECSLNISTLKQAHIHSQAHEQVPETQISLAVKQKLIECPIVFHLPVMNHWYKWIHLIHNVCYFKPQTPHKLIVPSHFPFHVSILPFSNLTFFFFFF